MNDDLARHRAKMAELLSLESKLMAIDPVLRTNPSDPPTQLNVITSNLFSIQDSLTTTDSVDNNEYLPVDRMHEKLMSSKPVSKLPASTKLPLQARAGIISIASNGSARTSTPSTTAPGLPAPTKLPLQVRTGVTSIASNGPARTSTPSTKVSGPGQNRPLTIVAYDPAESNGRQGKSTRDSGRSPSRRARSGTSPVSSASGQNGLQGASASITAPIDVCCAPESASNVPRHESPTIHVGPTQTSGQHDRLDVSARATSSSESPVSILFASALPVNFLDRVRTHCVLGYNPLGSATVTFESVQSIANSGHTRCLAFSSLEEAAAANRAVATVPEDSTFPRDTRLKKAYVWLLCIAFHTVQFAIDVDETDKGLSFPGGYKTYAKKPILDELRAWQMLELMIRRHSIGGSLDPEKTREYETFADRFNACFSALLGRKSFCKHLLEPAFMDRLVENPQSQIDRAKSNDSTNARKRAQIAAGQAALAESASGSPPPGPLPRATRKPRATKAKASSKRKNSGNDGAQGSASKRART